MEEDQEAQQHIRENQQGSLAGNVKGEEGSEAEDVNKYNEHRSWICHICNKGFGSGKALGGHMRIHNLSKKQVHRAKQGGSSVAKSKTNKWMLVNGNPTCSLCGKSFSSMKSLFGHLRSHPESVRKGMIQNNTTSNSISTTPINGAYASSNSTSSSTLSDDSAVDLFRALGGCWSVTAKRGRRSSSSCSKSSSGLEDDEEIEPRKQEASYELMVLATVACGNPKWEEELDGDQNKEKPLNKGGCEEGVLIPVFGDSDEVKIQRRVTKKMKSTKELEADDGNKLVNRCKICNTSFSSHQALESHLCRSENSKNIQVMDESKSDDVSGTKEEEQHSKTTMQGEETGIIFGGSAFEAIRGYHQCKIINNTFSTGQVSGDHKRSNWTSMAEAQSAQATSSTVENGMKCSRMLSFDLNQLPAMDEEEGVQSDLFIPANIMTSFTYDSSSQN